MSQFLSKLFSPLSPPAAATPVQGQHDRSILDQYVLSAPSAQNAVNVFAGEWSSSLPLDGVSSGVVPLFSDGRVEWALKHLGDVTGTRILEFGPLEGGHTYQFSQAGASVLAIEAHSRAYLKCLIAKELLGMTDARFMLGDFMSYLRETEERFHAVFACGVLYHMRNPVETIALSAKVSDNLFLWTHYYDEGIIRANARLSKLFTGRETATYGGFEHTLNRYEYGDMLEDKRFCGGSAPQANWLTRADLFGALEHFGWQVVDTTFEHADHSNGPALAVFAKQR